MRPDEADDMLRSLSRLARLRIESDHKVELFSTASGKLWTRRVHVLLTPTITACVEACGDVLTVYTPQLKDQNQSRVVDHRPISAMFTEKDGKFRFLYQFDYPLCEAIFAALQRTMVLDALSDV